MNLASLRNKIKFLHPRIYRAVSSVRPQRIQIQTTSVCNADCDFCPYSVVSQEVPMGNMSEELFCKVIRNAARFGIRTFSLYLLNEPFVDRRIAERTRFVTDLGGLAELSTNGSLLTEERGRAVLNAGLTRLVVNMPSVLREEYQRIVTKLDYDNVMANIEALSRYGREYRAQILVQVNVRPGRNEASVERTLRHWRSRGLNVKQRAAMDWAGNVDSFSQNIYIHNLGGCSDFRHLSDMHVLFNGDVILCCEDWRRTTHLGNAAAQSLEEIYFGRPYFEIRKKVQGLSEAPERFLCRRCEFALPKR